MNKKLILAIGWAGLLAGTLDILAACGLFVFQTGIDPTIILRYIASGVFGLDALTGGWKMNVLGGLFHFVIAYGWTILFFLIYTKLPKGSWILHGLIYGFIVWLLMNQVVVPLSKIPQRPFNWNSATSGAIIIMLMIGLPISYHARKYYAR